MRNSQLTIRLRPPYFTSLLSACMLLLGINQQVWATAPAPEGYFLQVVPVATHTSGELEGMTTYRVYLKCLNATDYLSSCSGDENSPLSISSSTGSWWNSPLNPSWNASLLNPAFFASFPEMVYDSYLTIGAADSSTPAGEHPNSIWGPNDISAQFLPGGGTNVVLDDAVGGAWYTPFPGAEYADSHAAFAGDDLQIMIMQITTFGELSGQTQLQVFMNADQGQEWRDVLVFQQAVPGCMDEEACNYDPSATSDDGSCIYADPYADCDGVCFNDVDEDGVCDEVDDMILGCTVVSACNYEPTATNNDGTCDFPDTGFNCDGSCINDGDGDGVCDEHEIPGCMDDQACNYDASATDDSGDCTYAEEGYDCEGVCYDDDADGVCNIDEVMGCQDEDACNYDASATDDSGDCTFAEAGFDCDGQCIDTDMDGVCDLDEVAGCQEESACNYDASATDDSGDCTFAEAGFDCDGQCIDTDMDGVCDLDELAGCQDEGACNYDATATDDSGDCTYAEIGYDCDGVCYDDDADGVCNVDEIPGCMDMEACNYDLLATDDAGTCEYAEEGFDCDGNCIDSDLDGVCDADEVLGCTDMDACNYDALATEDDGSCELPLEFYDCDGNCLNDADGDGICDELEVAGCTDMDACNYDSLATDNDDSCEFPGDTCDDGDDSTVNDMLDADCNCVGEPEVDGLGDLDARSAWDVVLYPNPALYDLHIEVINPGTIDGTVVMMNMAGQQVRLERLDRTTTLDVRDLPAGVYLVRIEGTWGIDTRRVVLGSAR